MYPFLELEYSMLGLDLDQHVPFAARHLHATPHDLQRDFHHRLLLRSRLMPIHGARRLEPFVHIDRAIAIRVNPIEERGCLHFSHVEVSRHRHHLLPVEHPVFILVHGLEFTPPRNLSRLRRCLVPLLQLQHPVPVSVEPVEQVGSLLGRHIKCVCGRHDLVSVEHTIVVSVHGSKFPRLLSQHRIQLRLKVTFLLLLNMPRLEEAQHMDRWVRNHELGAQRVGFHFGPLLR
mmetsp:Transcript_64610/g.179426  ORF Transcript_64610/g.179426 Transcript_64610/m.179426 type:complete len:232 (+) Transcript_64610:355-1050(+)